MINKKMRILGILYFVLLNSAIATAQILKGNISDKEGAPVQYSTVYIQELKQGTVANTRGDYEIRLPAGNYNVSYQSLGYEIETRKVTIAGKNTVNLNVSLQPQYYVLPEVRVSSTGEDPAYSIMRKAIGLAPYYMNQVKSYTANVYLKGNLEIIKIPRLLQKTLKIEANNTKIKAGDSFMMESVNEITFTAPDKYVQRVISFNSTFPTEGNEISPMDYIQASFYEPVIADMAISPLSPEAFSHYNFKYEGATLQGETLVNKIAVIPKRKSQQLFSGTIYIIEDLWCLQSVDLSNDNLAGKVRLQQLFVSVQDGIWLPVSHNLTFNLEIIGLRANAGYNSSVRYSAVTINSAIPKPEALPTSSITKPLVKTDTVKSKNSIAIEKLLSDDDLSNMEMVRLSRLMEKESAGKEKSTDLEIKERTTQIVEKDATRKDSAYWADIRPIPLSESDLRSIRISSSDVPGGVSSDSLSSGRRRGNSLSLSLGSNKNDDQQNAGGDSLNVPEKKKSAFLQTVSKIAFENTWADTNRFSFRNGGLITLSNLSFNTVDGFIYGTDFRISKTWENNNNFSVYPEIRWAFERKKLLWSVNSTYSYNPLRQQQIYLMAGITSRDFNNNGGINPLINSITTLFIKKNYLKLYDSRYLTIGHRVELVNGLYFNFSGTYEDRRVLINNTDFSIVKRDRIYSDNIPENKFISGPAFAISVPRNQKHADFSASFSYTPRQRYRINNGRKIPAGSDYPTFTLSWKHGMNRFSADSVTDDRIKNYDFIKIDANNSRSTGAFGEYTWTVRAGSFLNNSSIPFQDYTHFNSQSFPVLLNNYQDAFILPGFYALSTPRLYIEGHFKYTTPYLLLKFLPGLSNTLIRENLSVSYLYTHLSGSYTEVGYSLSEVLLFGQIGVYTGFKNFNYSSTGLKIVLRFN